MNTILRHAILCMALLCGLASCDKVKEADRWIPEAEGTTPSQEQSTILVEEYTGQKCVNCPGAASELKKIAEANPNRVITVAMHAASLGQTKELASAEADTYAKEYGIPKSLPGIVINRKELSREGGKYSQSKALWSALIRGTVQTKAKYRISLKASGVAGGQIQVDLKVTPADGKATPIAPIGLQLWVVEDVRAEQLSPSGKKDDYLHHNVFRGALNGAFGEDYTANTPYSRQFDLPSSVQAIGHAKVVAFVFDRSSKEVYEAAIVSLGEGIKPETEDGMGQNGGGSKDTSGALSFKNGDQELSASGETVYASEIEYAESLSTFEVVSPIVYISSGSDKKRSGLTLEIVKDPSRGAQGGGLSQVCTDLCEVVSDPNKYTKTSYELSPEGSDFVQIHYKIDDSDLDRKSDYRVRLIIKDGDRELASLTFVFRYDPAKKPQREADKPLPPPAVRPEEPSKPLPAPSDPTPLEPKVSGKSNVVALDFTGKGCPACPPTIEALASHSERLGSSLIVVAMHSYYYRGDGSLWTQEGSPYEGFNRSRINGYPTVVLNNKQRMAYSRYSSEIEHLIEQKPQLQSAVSAKRTGKEVELSFVSKATEANNPALQRRKLSVLFWIAENKILDYQANRGYNYEHNHVFRGTLNGTWGQSYTLGKTISLKASLPQKVKEEANTELIAIVLDESTKEFVDAVKVAL